MWSERGTDSNHVPGRPDPDDLGGHVPIHESAELIRHGARPCLNFGLSRAPEGLPVRHPCAGPDRPHRPEQVRRVPLVLDLPADRPARSTASPP
jgi:hypothetical protein